MKIIKWALIIWSVCATLIVLLAMVASRTSRAESQVFCAYDRLFVEFEENGKRWGAIMLDFDGKPIPCYKEKEIEMKHII